MSKARAKKGAGRPCFGVEPMKSYTFRATLEQKGKFDRLGGGAWLRNKIDAAKDPQGK